MSVRPFPRVKKPRPRNQAESSQPRARAAIQSGNLRSSQAAGTPEQGDGYGLGRRPWLLYPASCARKLVTGGLGSSYEGSWGETASLVTLAPAASRTHSCAPTRKPGFSYGPDRVEGRATGAGQGARLSGILEPLGAPPVGCLPALSQGPVVTGTGSEPSWALRENISRWSFSSNEN